MCIFVKAPVTNIPHGSDSGGNRRRRTSVVNATADDGAAGSAAAENHVLLMIIADVIDENLDRVKDAIDQCNELRVEWGENHGRRIEQINTGFALTATTILPLTFMSGGECSKVRLRFPPAAMILTHASWPALCSLWHEL